METSSIYNCPYISCIKINGLPILPPLITSSLREELKRYKQKAIEIEGKRERNSLLTDLEQLQPHTENLLKSQQETKSLTTLENQLTFISSNSDDSNSINNVPCVREKSKALNLTRETIDVYEYSDGVKFINESTNNGVKVLHIDDDKTPSKSTSIEKTESDDSNIISTKSTPKPRLIRSNSYTLDCPSPILLAHLQKEASIQSNEDDKLKPSSIRLNRNWSSIDNNYKSFEATSNKTDNYQSISPTTVIENKVEFKANAASSPIQVTETDITVQRISVSAPIDYKINVTKDENLVKSKQIEPQLFDILRNIPNDYSKKIVEILENQKKEQELMMESYETLKKQLLIDNNIYDDDVIRDLVLNDKNKINSDEGIRPNETSTPIICDDDKSRSISFSSSQSLYYTLSNSANTLVSPMEKNSENGFDEKISRNEMRETDISSRSLSNCSKELFPVRDLEEKKRRERQWAASVIGAAVRGYLVRRLMKTEKVKLLIETIKDAVLCAFQLQSAKTIDQSDVELHRRLIHQVSSACYSFHDIFFSSSIKDQMDLIAKDRQLLKEKASRPVSASGARRSSSNTQITQDAIIPRNRLKSASRKFSRD